MIDPAKTDNPHTPFRFPVGSSFLILSMHCQDLIILQCHSIEEAIKAYLPYAMSYGYSDNGPVGD